MIDKSLGIFLMVLFGVSGMVILALAWVWPMPASERILTTVVGSVGLFVALNRALVLRSSPARTDAEQVRVKVEVKDKP